MNYEIKIGHLYPYQMNLYGDRGNIIALTKRCEWRGIKPAVIQIHPGDDFRFSDIDILFMGGGQDRGQEIIAKDLMNRGSAIKEEIETYMPALVVCGGYQLFGNYFKTLQGIQIPGIGIFDAWTVGGEKRLIGNVVVDIRDLSRNWTNEVATLVGFENHSGRTYLGKGAKPLGQVIEGYGNNSEDRSEGARYKNCYGTYLHGSLLPKNPAFTDHLIHSALKRKYGEDAEFGPLDDVLENQAHEAAIARTKKKTL